MVSEGLKIEGQLGPISTLQTAISGRAEATRQRCVI